MAPAGSGSAVRLRFTPSPEHVRTARLVAVSVARRLGYDEAVLDEIRLAVGEGCARAVRRCAAAGVLEPVEVALDDADGLTVEVVDRAGRQLAEAGRAGDAMDADIEGDAVSLALVEGLADTVAVEAVDGDVSALRLSWGSPSGPR